MNQTFNLLSHKDGTQGYYITSKVPFNPLGTLGPNLLNKTFDFAYQMTFANAGEHRAYRSGGTHHRRNGEIFANTFQGKLAEFALYFNLKKSGVDISEPDLGVFGLGEWDSVDLMIGSKSISIKSTKSFGNLLLLETKDWDEDANYLPNEKSYDYTFLIRMKPFCEDIMRRNRLLFSDDVDRELLYNLIFKEKWSYDIPGYVTREDLIQIIKNHHILPRRSYLNGNTQMDAENYYIQAGDMRSAKLFKNELEEKL